MITRRASVAERTSILKRSPEFSDLSDSGLCSLAGMSILREYEEGEPLFFQDEPAGGFYVLVRGSVNVYRTGMDGRRQILHVFDRPGDVCGEVAVFEGGTYPAAAEASIPSSLLYLPRSDFLATTRRHPEILLEMLATLSKRLRRFVGLIDDLSLKDVGARLSRHLIGLSDEAGGGDVIRLATTKTVLAERLGTISETVSRTLRKLQARDLIEVEGRRIRILDRDGLLDIAEGGRSL